MTRPLLTGSKAESALACPASQALPQIAEEVGDPAERGTAMHEYLRDVGRIGVDVALNQAPAKWREACAAIDLERLPQIDPRGYAAEVAFAYNVETGEARELGRGVTREEALALYAELPPEWIPLTVDVVGLAADGERVSVGDYKTGWKRVTAAARNAQLLLGALAATRAYGRSSATVSVIYIREDERPIFDAGELADWDLDAFAERLRVGAAAIRHARSVVAAGQMPDVFMGEHCRFCPARRACPAQTALVHAVASSPATFREDSRQLLTPARAAEARRRLKLAKAALHMVDVELQAYASEAGGIDMGDGVVYGPRRSMREAVKGPVVHQVLTQLHSRDIADRAVTFESTKSAIDDALRKVAQDTGAKISHLNKAALDAIRAAGGVDEKVTTVVDEHRPKKKPADAVPIT